MNEPLRFDLVAIGGGFAGLCAALRAAELGLRAAVIEAGSDENYLCSSRWAGGIFHVSYHDVKLGPDQLLAAINQRTGDETDPQLATAIAANAGRWPGRIGKGAARTGCLARWAAGCASVRVGCCSGRARGRCG